MLEGDIRPKEITPITDITKETRALGSLLWGVDRIPAEAVKAIPETDRPDRVASLTYKEIGSVATRFGFEALPASNVDAAYAEALKVNHDIFNLYNPRGENKPERPLVPTIVTMPTEEFIAHFSPDEQSQSEHEDLPRAA
jgi:hypothetical protein